MIIGAQLFTLREYCKTLSDFSETLKKVADMGYTAVQISGVCPYEGNWLAEELEKNGLTAPLTHTPFGEIVEKTAQTIEKHRQFGCSRIGLGAAPGGMNGDNFEGFLQKITPAVKEISAAGAKFYYHNHWQEFQRAEGGRFFMEKLCDAFPPEELGIVLDTYWVQFAGSDPAAWISALKGRVDCVHFKDMDVVDSVHRMTPVGEGNLNWPRILSACEQAGTEYVFAEQDRCNGQDPFDCLKRSYEFMKALGLE